LKPAIIGVLCVLTILLSGCGAVRFGYNRAPTLSHWWLDGFADFTSAQDLDVRPGLETFFRWHRTTQLTDYAQLLVRAQAEVQQPSTGAQACRWYSDVLGRLQPMVQQGVPLVVKTAQSLSPKQLQHIERKFIKRNKDFAGDYLQKDPDDRLEASVTRTVERAESLYGSLEAAQKEEIRQTLQASPFDPQLWLAERKARQQDVVATLRRLSTEKMPADEAQAALRALVERFERSPRPAYRDYLQRLQQYNCDFAARLHNSTSRKQRLKAVEKLKGWEEDFRVLAAQGP